MNVQQAIEILKGEGFVAREWKGERAHRLYVDYRGKRCGYLDIVRGEVTLKSSKTITDKFQAITVPLGL